MLARFFVAIIIFCLLPANRPGLAQDNPEYSIFLDAPTIQKGYTVDAFAGRLKLSLVPGILSSSTRVQVLRLDEDLPLPWRLDALSPVYQFEFLNKAAYDDHRPFHIQFAYDRQDNNHKQVFFYDKGAAAWRPLPTRDFPAEGFVRSLIHLPYARIAVFSRPGVLTSGRASWYAHKPGDFTASPDFPAGSRLRVTAQASGKFVDVTVNDHGPDRRAHPDRVVDLEKSAFAKIAPLGAGTIAVTVEPLSVPAENGLVLGVSDSRGVGTEPAVTSRAALVWDEAGGAALFQKDAGLALPLASLTKLVAATVFMETAPDLERTHAYSVQDEKLNYEHAKEWEAARLRVADGDILSAKDLLYASLAGSANNTVETLVRASGLGRADFIARMNSLVREWGATGTRFIEPSGLAPENVSSARDYAIISMEAAKDPVVAAASVAPEYRFTTRRDKKAFTIRNTNQLVRAARHDINLSKTGYLHEAGYCLMVRAEGEGGRSVTVVTFGAADRATSFYETEELLKYGLKKVSETL